MAIIIFFIGYYSIVTIAYHLEQWQQSTNAEAAVCTFDSGAAVSQGWGSDMSVHHSEVRVSEVSKTRLGPISTNPEAHS